MVDSLFKFPSSCEGAGFSSGPDGLEHCNFCGSITLEEAITLLGTPGTCYSGADWKYGYPHKFYIGNKKFYINHTAQATTDLLQRWNAVADATIGIFFERDGGGVKCLAPCFGYQAAGTVGGERREFRPAEA